MDLKNKTDKLATAYKVRTVSNTIKDVDLQKRTVTGLFNSYFFIDSDLDMLLPNSSSKSIQERGVGTTSGNKIKHLKDHNWKNVIARLDTLDERKVNFGGREIEGLYHESYYSKASDSDDMLTKIQEGLYDDRSIGFQYVKLDLAERESERGEREKLWQTYYPLALNPEVADKHGYFWVVPEIKLFEGSDVAFGANMLTPMLGMKSRDSQNDLRKELNRKLDIISSIFKSGNLTDEGFQQMEMEKLQIKAYIDALTGNEPTLKDTILQDSRQKEVTQPIRKRIF